MKQRLNRLLGRNEEKYDEDVEFEETDFARCFIRGGIEKKNETSGLKISEVGWKHVRKQDDMISLVGLTGNGKSTVGSTMYNVLRGDKCEYFEASDSMNSFTQGIWSIKSFNAEKDKLTILDLQGLENEESVHQLLIIGMILSKALVFCSKERFDFSMLKTVAKGFELINKLGIKLDKPIMYLQVKWGQYKKNQIVVVGDDRKKRTMDKKGFIEYVKGEYAALKDCDIRVFGLPRFDEDEGEDRFLREYFQQVELLVDDLIKIDKGQGGAERVKYATTVVKALNCGSTKLIAEINLFSFKDEIGLCRNEYVSSLRQELAHSYKNVIIEKKMTKQQFIEKINYVQMIEQYKDKFVECGKKIKYYDSKENKEMESIINDICNKDFNIETQMKSIDIDLYYKQACNVLYEKNKKIYGMKEREYSAFVTDKIKEDISRIRFWDMYATISLNTVNAIEGKKRQLVSSLQGADLPNDFLGNDYRSLWNAEYYTKRIEWQATRDRERKKK